MIALTNSSKNILGMQKDEWIPRNPRTLLWCKNLAIPVESKHIYKIKSKEEFDEVVSNLKNKTSESFEMIKLKESEIVQCKNDIKYLKTLKVKKSSKTVDYFIKKLKEKEENRTERDICWPSFNDSTKIENCKIIVPRRCEPFMYNTEDDLLAFEIGDKVEITFGGGVRVPEKYKNKTIPFVVNNFLAHKWRQPTKRLALTPVNAGWLKKDIIFLDDTDRFECLMIDLFPVNRIPFRGWRSKEVKIKKIGRVESIPNPKIMHEVTLGDLTKFSDDTDVLLCSYWSSDDSKFNVKGIAKGHHFQYQCRKIYTTADVKLGLKFLTEEIDRIEKSIVTLKENIEQKKIMLSAAEDIKNMDIFQEIPCPQ